MTHTTNDASKSSISNSNSNIKRMKLYRKTRAAPSFNDTLTTNQVALPLPQHSQVESAEASLEPKTAGTAPAAVQLLVE